MVRGTKAETVIEAVKHIGEDSRERVLEVTMDLSESMRKIVEICFPRATRVIDRFHVQKLALEAVQEIRIKRRWEAIDADNKSFGRSNPHVVASRHCERKRSNL